MPYNRRYSMADVAQILRDSEGRARPGTAGANAKVGHALAQHTNARTAWFGRRNDKGVPIEQDTTFLIPPSEMVGLVHEALNSVPGQIRLAKLNSPQKMRTTIKAILIRRGKGFDIFINHQPDVPGAQLSFDWLSATNGNGFIFQLVVVVDKLPQSPREEIHVHTAYADQFARLQDDDIVAVKPPGSA